MVDTLIHVVKDNPELIKKITNVYNRIINLDKITIKPVDKVKDAIIITPLNNKELKLQEVIIRERAKRSKKMSQLNDNFPTSIKILIMEYTLSHTQLGIEAEALAFDENDNKLRKKYYRIALISFEYGRHLELNPLATFRVSTYLSFGMEVVGISKQLSSKLLLESIRTGCEEALIFYLIEIQGQMSCCLYRNVDNIIKIINKIKELEKKKRYMKNINILYRKVTYYHILLHINTNNEKQISELPYNKLKQEQSKIIKQLADKGHERCQSRYSRYIDGITEYDEDHIKYLKRACRQRNNSIAGHMLESYYLRNDNLEEAEKYIRSKYKNDYSETTIINNIMHEIWNITGFTDNEYYKTIYEVLNNILWIVIEKNINEKRLDIITQVEKKEYIIGLK